MFETPSGGSVQEGGRTARSKATVSCPLACVFLLIKCVCARMAACARVRAARACVRQCNHGVFLFPITALIHQLVVAMAFPLSAQSKAERREDNHVTTPAAAFDTTGERRQEVVVLGGKKNYDDEKNSSKEARD